MKYRRPMSQMARQRTIRDMFITVDRYISAFMKARILIAVLALLLACVSIGSCVKMVVDSPKIASSPMLQGISKINVSASPAANTSQANFDHLYGTARIVEEAGSESRTLGSVTDKPSLLIGGEENVESHAFGDMGGEENVERQDEGREYGTVYGNATRDGVSEVFSQLAPSTIVYFGESSIPLSSYQNTLGKYLWIESYGGLSQYASVAQYTSLYLMAYTSASGPGEFLEIYPSPSNQGIYQKTDFYFNSGYNRIPYRSDVAGKHYLLFSMDDQSSNAVIIDVANNRTQGSLHESTFISYP